MFEYCVWFELLEDHEINKIIKKLSKKFKTNEYNAHLTIQSNMNLKNAFKVYNKYKNELKPTLRKNGTVYQTRTCEFYALQQDYVNETNNTNYHISLAYKVDCEFSEWEINQLENLELMEKINPDDMKITIWNCDSKYANKWTKILF